MSISEFLKLRISEFLKLRNAIFILAEEQAHAQVKKYR